MDCSQGRQDATGQFEPAGDAAPLIVTLALAGPEQARFDRLRQAHFPSGRTVVDAHVTLFHHLPGLEIAAVQRDLAERCRQRPVFAVAVNGLRSLGRGVAFTLASPELGQLRAALASSWAPWLTPQDRQRYQPHITIQNKAAPDEARALLEAMRVSFAPFTITAEGLSLWRYRGGPWEPAGRFDFIPLRPASPS